MYWNLQNSLDASFFGYNNSGSTNNTLKIFIYPGTMPTPEDVWTNWNTVYNSTGNLLLGTYTGSFSTGSNVVFSTANSINDSSTEYYRDGVASWAVIRNRWIHGSGVDFNDIITNGLEEYLAITLCDVSGQLGNGIVKLDGTSISGSMPEFVDLGFTITHGD